jgi:hypothetical protein
MTGVTGVTPVTPVIYNERSYIYVSKKSSRIAVSNKRICMWFSLASPCVCETSGVGCNRPSDHSVNAIETQRRDPHVVLSRWMCASVWFRHKDHRKLHFVDKANYIRMLHTVVLRIVAGVWWQVRVFDRKAKDNTRKTRIVTRTAMHAYQNNKHVIVRYIPCYVYL